MLWSPVKAVEEGWIEGAEEVQIQQNGVDVRLDSVKLCKGGELSDVSLIRQEPLEAVLGDEGQLSWALLGGLAYDFTCQEIVRLPSGVCAFIIQRSSLNRMGCCAISSWFDSGFEGHAGLVAHPAADLTIFKGARVAQILFFQCYSASLYVGGYKEDIDVL